MKLARLFVDGPVYLGHCYTAVAVVLRVHLNRIFLLSSRGALWLSSVLCWTEQTDLKSVLKKIACDEAVFAPQLACSYLATSSYIQTPGDWKAVKGNVKDKVRQG